MSSNEQKAAIRRSDPSLREQSGKDPFRPFGLPKWIGLLLYAVFSIVLVVPLIRRWRRRESWTPVRLGIGVTALAMLGVGLTLPAAWVTAAGGILLLAALLLPAAPDPDKERKLQARHGADYLLNGGRLISGELPSADLLGNQEPLYLLLRGRELLIVPRNGDGRAHATVTVDDIRDVLVAGKPYFPVYVSEAKDPPVREEHVDQSATTLMELVVKGDKVLRFEYAGAFSKHLAETAAHAIYSVRKLNAADGVGGQPPEVFHVIGR